MGSLVLVPTPIGNLEDITLRAIRVLKEADIILAEDTRTTGVLLKKYDIQTPMKSFHAHNEHKSVAKYVSEMEAGKWIAQVSDAGTPGISDPGYLLIRECLKARINVESLPGPTAFIPALLKSGLPMDRFVFEGFLPQKKGRLSRIESLKVESRTLIFYESPHRLLKTLQQLAEIFGPERMASVSRELTKIHEETINGSLMDLINVFNDKAAIKGEIVIVVSGASEKNKSI